MIIINQPTDIVFILISYIFTFFWLHLPIAYFRKHKTKKIFCVTIPLSLSTEIILGYIFYSLKLAKIFPFIFIATAILLNLFALILLLRKNEFKPNFEFKQILPTLLLFFCVFSSRLYFSLTNIGPIHPDTIYHYQYLQNIFTYKVLPLTFYPPGFHTLTYGLFLVIKQENLIRFAGPILGLFICISLFLFLKDFFENKNTKYLLLLLLSVPIFNLFFLQTVIFWPSALSYLFLIFIIFIFFGKVELEPFQKNTIVILSIISLGITIPYLFVQILVFSTVLAAYSLLSKKNTKKSILFTSFIFIGFVVSYGHIYLQKKIWGTGGFPLIKSEQVINGQTVTVNNFSNTKSSFLSKIKIPTELTPVINTIIDLTTIKTHESLFLLLRSKTGIWLMLNLILIILYFIKKYPDELLLPIIVLNIVFSIIALTGNFEMDYYRGRTGTYVLLLVIVTLVYLFDLIATKLNFRANNFKYLIAFASIPTLFYPVTPIGNICPDSFNIINKIYTSNPQPIILSNKYDLIQQYFPSVYELNLANIELFSGSNNLYIILENDTCSNLPDEYYSKLNLEKNTNEYDFPLPANFSRFYQNNNLKVFKQTN